VPDSEYLSNRDHLYQKQNGNITGPQGGIYQLAGIGKDGNLIYTNNGSYYSFTSGKKISVTSPATGGIETVIRPSLTEKTKNLIYAEYMPGPNGTYIHRVTGKIVTDPQIGHLYGYENRYLVKTANEVGLTQKQFKDFVNQNYKKFFELQNKSDNLSHVFEAKSNIYADEISRMMTNFKNGGN
jgi:predicted transcriptional regulator with HTH domain